MSSQIATGILKKVAGNKAQAYEAADPQYEQHTDERTGKIKRRKRAMPEGLSLKEQKILKKVRRRAHLLDKGFHICGLRFGWTFMVGLIPVVGDVADAYLGYTLVIKQAKKADIPDNLLTKMQLNTLLATGIGMIPLIGDIIMATFKPNSRNAMLFEEFLVERVRLNESAGQPGAEGIQAQQVLDRANAGTWSSLDGTNDALHVGHEVPNAIAYGAGRIAFAFFSCYVVTDLIGTSSIQSSDRQFTNLSRIEASLGPLFEKTPEYRKTFQTAQIPERIITFRVTWEDDKGECQVNTGYRVEFNSCLGPYKGGLRFHPSVNLSILKFLGFEQVFKNALTGLMMGGGKGGADFDPKEKSDNEIRKFCEAFMRELSRHIGANTDVPAGDIGVGGREIGYMFGAYKRFRNEFAGVLTGKGLDWGGSLIRPEATGYGLIYYVQHMIAEREGCPLEDTFKGKTVLLSGSGNVAQYAAYKVLELGGKILSLSDSTGSLISKNGHSFSAEDIAKVADIKLKRQPITSAGLGSFEYIKGSRPWTLVDKIDIALPCATQNEVSEDEAKALIKAGCRYVAEGSNMGSTQEAINVFESARKGSALKDSSIWLRSPEIYFPISEGKASNCGGVAVSGLEMCQDAAFTQWSAEVVDQRLSGIMSSCYKQCFDTAKEFEKEGLTPSLVMGANIAGFKKVANAMRAQGDVW
ncbi:MAG: hypothetical protein CYPHOPRED_003060 [Cyphobasidiales sp. Tagirdzhanova-0007]|nr:MAG: hypothetical protein CYPHOPRED_003060 [Cyphobasidiales sp. Tagirdzhanova-0007]